MFILWLKFIITAAIVVFSGYKICIYAEKIGRITKIGNTFVGLILLAAVTSLPELAVTISATRIFALDLALGDLFGSNLFNLTIVGIIFLRFIKKPELLKFDFTHFMSSAFSLILISLAAMGIVFYNFIYPRVGYSNIFLDIETFLILGMYIFGAYLILRSERTQMVKFSDAKVSPRKNILEIWLKFLLYSAIVMSSAIYLSRLGDRIAQIPIRGIALGGTFVGSLFVAVTTSLPEMAVAISAVRLGFMDLALGNIFGSNMFNMAIISITDLCLGRRIILSCASSLHLFTVFFVIISTGLVVSSLIYRSKKKVSALSWDTISIISVYFIANLVSFYLR